MIYEYGHQCLFHILLRGHTATRRFYKKPQVLAVAFYLLKESMNHPTQTNNPVAEQHRVTVHDPIPLSNLQKY